MYEKDGEKYPDSIEDFKPGCIFEYANSSKLASFEDEVAERFITDEQLADRQYETWGFREKLIDLIRPDKYYGPIRNITLSVIPDAYERVFDFKKRGKKYQGHKHPQVRTVSADSAIKMTIGFELTFDTKKESFCSEVYYVPIAEKSTTGQRVMANTGGVINRYLAIPEIIPPAGTETSKSVSAARTIGAETVRRCTP